MVANLPTPEDDPEKTDPTGKPEDQFSRTPSDVEAIGSALFAPGSRLILQVKSTHDVIQLSYDRLKDGVIVGRRMTDDDPRDFLDTIPLEGEDLGVSREHLYLCVDSELQAVVISDLNSTNGTLINSKPLWPGDTRVLRHGDMIQVSKLAFEVVIVHPA